MGHQVIFQRMLEEDRKRLGVTAGIQGWPSRKGHKQSQQGRGRSQILKPNNP